MNSMQSWVDRISIAVALIFFISVGAFTIWMFVENPMKDQVIDRVILVVTLFVSGASEFLYNKYAKIKFLLVEVLSLILVILWLLFISGSSARLEYLGAFFGGLIFSVFRFLVSWKAQRSLAREGSGDNG